jgi:hypothetical protein
MKGLTQISFSRVARGATRAREKLRDHAAGGGGVGQRGHFP